ncbi:hypothetical protein DPMN_153939 [Dreissena polymorpha]|uniref:Uncharacterized protein n=1 Tax=Dreissena polymorpha TaxID=45954 RepID=A0A9D4FP09_DREPO|nr:hypothetical protein DPMN_153939 [Dreissena polymorpha]
MATGAGAFLVPSAYSTPIGCRSVKSSSANTCLIKRDMTGFRQCPFQNESISLNLCGISVLGLTRQGLINGNIESAYLHYVSAVNYYTRLNAAEGYNIILDSDIAPNSAIMAAIFSPLRSEYKMWDGYTLPTLKVNTIFLYT